jgi:hypothetical protein
MSDNSGLGPAADLYLIANALRADRADVASHTRVLTAALGAALPPGMVMVQRRRSLADRLAGRAGEPVRLTVTTADEVLELRQDGDEVTGEVRRVVHGVTITRRRVEVDEWLVALAGVLHALAQRSASARTALSRLLGA